MTEANGMLRPELQALPQIKERMTFIYLGLGTHLLILRFCRMGALRVIYR